MSSIYRIDGPNDDIVSKAYDDLRTDESVQGTIDSSSPLNDSGNGLSMHALDVIVQSSAAMRAVMDNHPGVTVEAIQVDDADADETAASDDTVIEDERTEVAA